jgi:hypothetical protein
MIYEYAVSPNCFFDQSKVQILLSHFSKDQGRLLSDVPKKKWKILALAAINASNHKPIMRKTLKNALIKIEKQSLYRRHTIPACKADKITCNEKAWIDYAKLVHMDRPFHAIFSQNEYDLDDIPVNMLNMFELIEAPHWENPSTVKVKRTAEMMVSVIKPVLDCSAEVILVDRNFNPFHERYRNFLIELLKYLKNRKHSPEIKKIKYHVGWRDNDDLKTKERIFSKSLINGLPSGMQVQFILRPSHELHDRFILTDIGGIMYGHGLDEALGHNIDVVNVVRLSQDAYKKEWQDVQKQEVSFVTEKKF